MKRGVDRLERVRAEVVDTRRQLLYLRASLITISGNILLTAVKAVLAWFTGSSAVFSDAANSLADTFYSLLMGVGLYVSQQPADESHPQGHSLFEPMVSLMIAAAMALAGLAALWQSIQGFLGEKTVSEPGWSTAVLLGAVLIKVVMYLMVQGIARKVHSPAIAASARDNLVDIITSVTALLGVWGSYFIHPLFDPVAGLLVSLWIFRAVWGIAWENLGYLTGRGAPVELADKIAAIAAGVPGVDQVHRVIAEYIGPQLRVDMHINVDGNMTLELAHSIGERVNEQIESLPEVDLVFIHIEPTEIEKN